MPRLKAATDANGTKFYPVSITHGIYDTERGQKLTATLDAFESALSSMQINATTGVVTLTIGN